MKVLRAIYSNILIAMLAGAFCALPLKASAQNSGRENPETMLFDVHMHYHHLASDIYSPDQIIKLVEAAGVGKALLSSYPNENTHRLYDLAPSKFVLGLMPYRTFADRLDWFQKPECLQVIEDELNQSKYPYCVMGEFIIWDWKDTEHRGVRRLIQLAQQHNLPLIVTTGPAGVHKLFSQYPGAKMLLAHAGTYAKEPISNPGDLASLFDQYQNLSIDLAQLDSRFPALNIAPNGLLKPEWRDLFLKYPDRIMIGSDPLVAANWKNYSKYMDEIRGWLNQLPTNVGQQIAYQNANRFFGGCAKSFKLP